MDKSYIDLFLKLDLPLQQTGSFRGAEQFARGFKRCSVLEDYNTFYSVDSVANDPAPATAEVTDIQSYSSILAR